MFVNCAKYEYIQIEILASSSPKYTIWLYLYQSIFFSLYIPASLPASLYFCLIFAVGFGSNIKNFKQ